MWTLWHERNRRTFGDIVNSELQLMNCFISLLLDWSTALGLTSSTSALDFVISLSLSLHSTTSHHVIT
jgi:hypothetical protein